VVKMESVSFNSKVLNGKLVSNRKPLNDFIATFEGKEITITVAKKKKKRSNPQNSFYWGVVVPIVKDGLKGNGILANTEQTHELLKNRFLKIDLANEDTGEVLFQSVKSTSELTTSQFMEYLAEIQQFSAEFLGVQIPEPNEQINIQLQ
tara:strand:+ start:330 stop:776 length:447 start_codon:yes stop_codon:yes gene_type:complete